MKESHHLLAMLTCKNARENLDAINAKSAVYFQQPIVQLSK